MTFGGSSISNIAGAVGRSLLSKRTPSVIQENAFDLQENAPVLRSDIEAMLRTDVNVEPIEEVQVELLRASEKKEHDTLCQIRGALYPVELS